MAKSKSVGVPTTKAQEVAVRRMAATLWKALATLNKRRATLKMQPLAVEGVLPENR